MRLNTGHIEEAAPSNRRAGDCSLEPSSRADFLKEVSGIKRRASGVGAEALDGSALEETSIMTYKVQPEAYVCAALEP